MFSLFIVLLSFSSSLATKCLVVNNGPCMVRPILVDLNPVELRYYPFMISLNNYTGSCNVLSSKISVPKQTREINVKAFNMITNENEAKAMVEHISCDFKCKFNSKISYLNQKWNYKTCQCEPKNYRTCKKDYSWNPGTSIYENSNYSKSITDTSVTECDEIMIVIDNVSTKKTTTIAKNVMSTASINFRRKKVRDL